VKNFYVLRPSAGLQGRGSILLFLRQLSEAQARNDRSIGAANCCGKGLEIGLS
jgi:hypothetical protein